jgi:hypothetical protein
MNSPRFFISLFLLIVFGLISISCSSKELSRSTAQSIIEASPAFKEAANISLADPFHERMPNGLEKASPDEVREQAQQRVLERELQWQPQMAAANNLGLVSLSADFVKEDKAFMQIPAEFYFKVVARANSKGKALWKDYELRETDESLPIARKEITGITGITKLGENQAATDFIYEWIPNELGKTLDPTTEEFKRLPVEMQKDLTGKGSESNQNKSFDWSGERRGKALFQKYDDGWRLDTVQF